MSITMDNPSQASPAFVRAADHCDQASVASIGLATESRDNWRKVVRALEPLRRLRDDWDGLGAAAIPIGAVDTATELASYLRQLDFPAPTTVAPTPAGTILFTWDKPHDKVQYLEAEIMNRNSIEFMQINEDGSVNHA
jgi:hypothetical protein